MMTTDSNTRLDFRRNAAFSLVEVALAMLVLSVGILALFALFPSGLDANKKSIDDTQMALFAEEVLSGFRAQAYLKPWNGWDDSGDFTLEAAAPNMWVNPNLLDIQPDTSGTNVYVFAASTSLTPDYEDYAARYINEVTPVPGNPELKFIRFEIANGRYGTMNDAEVFYVEVYYTGL